MMARGHVFWSGMLGMLLAGTSASAAVLPRPTVDYAADVVMHMTGHGSGHGSMEVTGKVYVAGEKERRESTVMGHNSVVINRRDKKLTWVLKPEQKGYTEHGLGGPYEDPYASWEKAGVTLTELGQEKVNGVEATKYRAEAQAKEGHMDTGSLWMTKENIPVRLEAHVKGQDSELVVDYTNIKTGKQDAALFEVPPSYHKMDMPRVGGMPSGPGHAGSPAGNLTEEQTRQIGEKMQEMMKQSQTQSPGE